MTDDTTRQPNEQGTDEQDTEDESLRAKVQRLESLVEHQQAIIEELQARRDTDSADASESVDQETPAEDEPTTDEELSTPVGRRGVLTATGALGLLGLGAGSASASSGQIGTSSSPLNTLYTAELNGGVTGGTSLTNIAGSNLSIDNSGNLNASGGGGGGKWVDGSSGSSWLEPSESSDTKIEGIDTIKNSAGGLTVFTDGRRNLDLGTPTSGVDIRGTTGEAGGNVVAGHPANEVTSGASGVTISGGGAASIYKNQAGGDGAVIGGGARNDSTGDLSTVSGGYNNSATALTAAVLGGEENTATGEAAVVAGGFQNDATGKRAAVLGGEGNTADGTLSVAAGHDADTNGKEGAFVVGDKNGGAITAQNADEVRFQASGGFVVENGNVNAQGGTVENTTGGLTVTTNDNGDLTLDPGESNNVDIENGHLDLKGNNIDCTSTPGTDFKAQVDADGGGEDSQVSFIFPDKDTDEEIKWARDAQNDDAFRVRDANNDDPLFTVNDGGKVDIHNGDLDMNSSGSVTNTSDRRLKTAIEPIQDAVAKLCELEAATYSWEDEDTPDDREAGVIAQSVQRVLPEAVSEDEDGYLKLAYRQLTPLLIEATQEQQGHIDDLEAENEQLRERNADLEDRLAAVEAELGIDATANQQGVADD